MIKVTISYAEMQRLGHPYPEVLKTLHLMKQLREAGIPIVGVLSIDGVETGKLTMYRDQIFQDWVYEWAAA